MSQVISPKKTIEYLRKQDPYNTSYLNDEELYDFAQQKYPDIDWPVWEVEKPDPIKTEIPNLNEVDTAPSVWSKLAGFSFIDPENPITGRIIDDDSKYFQDTYNKSAAGLLYQAIEGKEKYAVGDYEPELLGEVGQFFLGHLAPVDVALFLGTGGVGGKAAQVLGKKYLADLGAKGLTRNLAKRFPKSPFIIDAVAKGSISGGVGLGGYGAASATIAKTAEQRLQIEDEAHPRKEFDLQEIAWEATKQGIESAALGAVSSGLVKGTLGTKYGFAKMAGKDKVFADKAAMVYGNPASQVFAEANAFTAGELAFGDEEFSKEAYIRGLGRNLGIMTGLKLPGLRKLFKRQSEDVNRILGQTREFEKAGADNGTFKNVLDSVQKENAKSSSKSGLLQEELLLEEIASKQLELREQLGGQQELSKMNKELGRIAETLDPVEGQRVLNKAVDKGFNELTKQEKATLKDVDYWLQNSNMHNNIMMEVYSDLRLKPEKYYDLLNKEAEKKGLPLLDEAARKRAMMNLEEGIGTMVNFHDFTNSIASGHTPVTMPKDAKFNFWKDAVEGEIFGKKVKEPVKLKEEVSIKEKKPTVDRQQKISDLVDKLSPELKKTPDQIRATKEYQTTLLDVEGKPILSLERLEKAYENVLAGKPKTPQADLKKVLVDVEANASVNKALDTRIDRKTPVREYLENSNLTKENKKMALVGFNEFMPLRKSGNTAGNYKELIDYFEFAQKKGKNVNTVNSEVTDAYIKANKYNLSKRNKLNNSLSAFYGTGQDAKVESIRTGFAYSYMGTEVKTPSIALMGESRTTGKAGIEKVGVAEPREYSKIQKVKSNLISKGEVLEGTAKKRKITPDTYDAATEMMYEFGSRGRDTLDRLMIENIDWKNGIIEKWSTGYGQKGTKERINVPLKEVIPELWNKLVKVKGDRTEGELFKTIDGSVLTGYDINKLNKEFLPTDIVLGGKKGKITVQDYRRMASTDATKTGRVDIKDFVDEYLVGHKQTQQRTYVIEDAPKIWKEFRELRKGQAALTPSKMASDAFTRLQDAGSLGTKDFFRQDNPNYTRKQKLQDAVVVGAEVLNQGFKTFKNFSGEMIKRVGDSIKPYLSNLYKKAKDYVVEYLKSPKIGLGIEVVKEKGKPKDIKIKGSDVKAALKGSRKEFNAYMKDINLGGKENSKARETMAGYIARLGDIENVQDFTKGLLRGKVEYPEFMNDLAKFESAFKDVNKGKLSNVSQKVKWFKSFHNVERLRIRPEVNIAEATLKKDMQRLGIKSGNIWDASLKQIQRYESLLKTIEFPDDARVNWLANAVIEGNTNPKLKSNIPTQLKARALPIDHFLESIGLNHLADKMRNHVFRELHHIGEGFVSFEGDAQNIMSGRIGKITRTSVRWERAKDRLWTLDQERYKEAFAEGTLSKGEKKFIEKAVDENWNPRTDTREGKLATRYKEFTKYYVKEFKESLKQIMSEAEYEKFIKSDNVKWIEDGFYVSRILTKDFKKKYNLNSRHIEEWVNTETLKYAKELAQEKYGTKDVSNQQINEFYENANGVIRAGIYDMMNLSTTKVSSRFLKRRHLKLPERIGNTKVYETSYENTMKVYANSMSKFLANIEIFPELVSMKGFNYTGVKAEIQKVKQSHGKWGNFIVDAVEHQVGKGKGSPFTIGARTGQVIANTLAKFGLSFPTSGGKNLMLGTTQTALAFENRDLAEGFVKILNAENRKSVRGTGGTEIGLRHLETGWMDRTLDATVFKTGLMKPTENFNRYLSVLTGRVEQGRLANIIRNNKIKEINPKKYEKAMRRFTDFYKLNKEDIALLQKYGMEGTTGHNFKTPYELAVQTRKVNNLYQKMDSMAHIKTQGASISLFMPEWADKSWIKPATLYKRMAYAATINTWDNSKVAWKNKNLMRIGMYTAGTYLTGQNLIAFYDKILGSPPPDDTSPWWRQIMTIMWRGEFLGLLSGILNPRGMLAGAGEIAEPAVYDNAKLAFNKIVEVVDNPTKLTAEYAVQDYMTRTYNGYNQAKKLLDKKNNPYSLKVKKYNKLYGEYEKQNVPTSKKQSGDWQGYVRNPYYRALEDTFNKGTQKEFVRQYIATIVTKASEYLSEGYSPNMQIRNETDAFEQAISDVNRMITGFNPNKGTLDKKDVGLKRSVDFLTWLKDAKGMEAVRDLLKAEAEYKIRKEKYAGDKALQYSLRQFNMNDFKKYFNPKKKKSIKGRKSMYWID